MYVMSYFRDERMAAWIAVSDDLCSWRDLNGGEPVIEFTPEENKIVRDPFILQDKHGVFHMFFTDNWRGVTLGYSKSKDLVSWDKPIFHNFSKDIGEVENCWAPEAVFDRENDEWIIFWSSRLKGEEPRHDRHYCVKTRDFISFTKAELFFATDYPIIDASVKYHDGKYYMAYKDERGWNKPDTPYKAIRTCVSSHAMGPYEDISPLLTEHLSEGPTIVKVDEGFVVFYDYFGKRIYKAMFSHDFRNFTDISDKISFPPTCKHFTVIEPDIVPEGL